jgi:SAM-dependent methyltransferase
MTDVRKSVPGSKWRSFWAEQVTPQHRQDTSDHYARYGQELRMLLPDRPIRKVLDIGCGNGALFKPLGFDRTNYTGVDFSESMIAAFRRRHPQVRLLVAEGDEYLDDCKYDLIFCNAVVQYFEGAMLDRLLGNASAMLAPDGCILIGSIPWQAARLPYYMGELSGDLPSPWPVGLRIVKSWYSDRIGHWYSVREVVALGRRHGLRSEIFGSVLYSYRFHALMFRLGSRARAQGGRQGRDRPGRRRAGFRHARPPRKTTSG